MHGKGTFNKWPDGERVMLENILKISTWQVEFIKPNGKRGI